ncbi:Aminopeptidase N, partial [Frankliniella fusca]
MAKCRRLGQAAAHPLRPTGSTYSLASVRRQLFGSVIARLRTDVPGCWSAQRVFTVHVDPAQQQHAVLGLGAVAGPRGARSTRSTKPLFDGLQPLVYGAALYGIVPIAVLPLRLSFHPLRSTLCWVALVQAYVWWEAFFKPVPPEAAPYTGPGRVFDTLNAFWSAHSVAHLSGCIIVPVFWAESRNIRRLFEMADSIT